jgi:hypothetical protein
MKPIFKQLKFSRHDENTQCIQESEFGFFVPGVNSGIYEPATLVVQSRIVEKRVSLFKFTTIKTFASMTLTPIQFDELFEEMEKIKKLRDTLKIS